MRCGWILPDGTFVTCEPWKHLESARNITYVSDKRRSLEWLNRCWDSTDEEELRNAFAAIGLVKVHDMIIDANEISNAQLRALQSLYELEVPEKEIKFIGRIALSISVRMFLKLRNPDRLNYLGQMA